jgi:hypothetical protein
MAINSIWFAQKHMTDLNVMENVAALLLHCSAFTERLPRASSRKVTECNLLSKVPLWAQFIEDFWCAAKHYVRWFMQEFCVHTLEVFESISKTISINLFYGLCSRVIDAYTHTLWYKYGIKEFVGHAIKVDREFWSQFMYKLRVIYCNLW